MTCFYKHFIPTGFHHNNRPSMSITAYNCSSINLTKNNIERPDYSYYIRDQMTDAELP